MSGRGVVLVTGAAGAIGSATAARFAAAGFDVVGLDREPAPDLAGGRAIEVDVTDAPAVARAVAEAAARGPLLHVVGIAGGALPAEPPARDDPAAVDPALFAASIAANLTSQWNVVHAAIPYLRAAEGDRSIALTSSFNALAGWGMPAYSAAKAGLIGAMRALTGPLGADGIRVNVVAPGTIRTPRTERIWGGVPGHFEALAATTALGRLGEPDDVARAFLALATLLTHVTGQVLVVDGGQSVVRPL